MLCWFQTLCFCHPLPFRLLACFYASVAFFCLTSLFSPASSASDFFVTKKNACMSEQRSTKFQQQSRAGGWLQSFKKSNNRQMQMHETDVKPHHNTLLISIIALPLQRPAFLLCFVVITISLFLTSPLTVPGSLYHLLPLRHCTCPFSSCLYDLYFDIRHFLF